MVKTSIHSVFSLKRLPTLAVILISIIFLATDFTHHNWTRTNPAKRGVIKDDINMYYAYLTAGIIEKDLKLNFMSEPGFKNEFRYWNSKAENGNRIIITSMGLAFLYLPFFLLAHLLAHIFGLATDGYGSIYQFFIVFGGLFYVILGLIILKNLLLRYFSTVTSSLTLILVAAGTNLYYYSTYEAAMSHVYNFFLITLFLRQVMMWYERSDWKNAIIVGALLGLISLIRPTNILVFFILFFWGVTSFMECKERIVFFLKRYYLVLIMLLAFIAVWTPQMLYWKMISGKFLYFSYGVAGASFYFLHPQVWDSLFSFIKGWYIYTPVMFVATLGIILLRKRIQSAFIPFLFLFITMVYVQSSWWSWWFGGGFGLRAYIDIYGIMAFPLAAIIEYVYQFRNRWLKRTFSVVLVFLLYLSWNQTYQYHRGMIHYCGMTKESYKINFLRFKAGPGYWPSIATPDHRLAREGIYYYYPLHADNSYLEEVDMQKAVSIIKNEISEDKKLFNQIKRYAKRNNMAVDEGMNKVAENIYFRKTKKER